MSPSSSDINRSGHGALMGPSPVRQSPSVPGGHQPTASLLAEVRHSPALISDEVRRSDPGRDECIEAPHMPRGTPYVVSR